LEIDPLLIGFLAGLAVAYSLSRHTDVLTEHTRTRRSRLFVAYSFGFALLYIPLVCPMLSLLLLRGDYCSILVNARVGLAQWLGTDYLGVVSVVWGFVGFAISYSGTRSKKWRALERLLFWLFVAALILRFVLIPIWYPSGF
jgi:hypothetical protein